MNLEFLDFHDLNRRYRTRLKCFPITDGIRHSYIARALHENETICLCIDKVVFGYACFSICDKLCNLALICARRHDTVRVGTSLMNHLIVKCRQLEVSKIQLCVAQKNMDRLVPWYRGFGFALTGEIEVIGDERCPVMSLFMSISIEKHVQYTPDKISMESRC
jgi:ribosomal protein S18 acetylase RimI-like enzyme